MKPRKPKETDAEYIARLQSANDNLSRERKQVAAWAKRVSRSVTIIASDASVVFQAMAEKARVRSHPSVTKAVQIFDAAVHPQWADDKKNLPELQWPTEWDFDAPGAQSGDADMELNSPIAEAIEYLSSRLWKGIGNEEREFVSELIAKLHAATYKRVEGVKEAVGFKPKHIPMPSVEHFKDMDRDQLIQLAQGMSWMALDLAQDMSSTNEMLRRDLRAAAYRRIGADLYKLAQMDTGCPPEGIDVKIIGAEEIPF